MLSPGRCQQAARDPAPAVIVRPVPRRHLAAARPRHARAGEAGSITLETVILFPLLLCVIFGAIQTGLWYHGRNCALAAAQEAARVAASYQGDPGRGQQAGQDFIARAGQGFLVDAQVTVTSNATVVTATVTGQVLLAVPLLNLPPVNQSASLPIERLTPP